MLPHGVDMIGSIAAHWITSYGYWGLTALLMLGVVGLPVPDETLLTFAGFLVYKGELQLAPTLLSAVVGSCLGITLSYAIGRFPGLYVVRKIGSRVLKSSEDHPAKPEVWFRKYGKWLLPFAYFVPGLRHLIAIVAGATKLSMPVFAVFAYGGALIWSVTFVCLGYTLGENWRFVMTGLHRHMVLAAATVVFFLAAWILLRSAVLRNKR
jgi:membrane protein DedA with SNARE-associated domain